MDDMDRHAFINTQRWACEITEEQKTKLVPNDDLASIFDGQCCFQSNFLTDDEGRLFLHFEVNEQYTDFVQLKLELFIVNMQCKDTTSQEPPQKRRKINSQVEQATKMYNFLLGCFDGRYFLVDHNQIQRIVNPVLEEQESTPFVELHFECITLRLYFKNNTKSQKKTDPAKQLKQVVDTIIGSLQGNQNINSIIQQNLTPRTQEQDDNVLVTKYRKWISFLNNLNASFGSEPVHDKNTTNELVNGYLESMITQSLVQRYIEKHPLVQDILNDKKINYVSEEPVVDFSSNLDYHEHLLEKEIFHKVEKMFSFSQTQTVPSTDALLELEKLMQKHTDLAKQGVLASSLIQKHFHE